MHPLYDVVRRLFFVIPPVVCPMQFFINAPFGRFTPSDNSIFLIDGIRAWIFMEVISPLAFLHAFANNPLATSPADSPPLTPTQLFLATLFLVHYANRAFLSPLRTPSRSKSHIIVPLCATPFNLVNGTLMATYLRSPIASAFFADSLGRPVFWVGITLWTLGFVGNVLHDEILLNIRRNAKAKGKAKARSDDDDQPHGKQKHREHYGIPHGYLYAYVSYPNYLCEWVEWFGFALAAAPLPAVTSFGALVSSVQPPWIFFFSEIFVMIARAYKGHQWYLDNFPDYPKERKVVIPHVF